LVLPWAQARANVELLEKMEERYNDISDDRKQVIQASLTRYLNAFENLVPRFQGAYPEVPQAAEYVPIDPCAELGKTINCSIARINAGQTWAKVVGRLNAQSDLTRIVMLDPRWLANLEAFSRSTAADLRGELPTDDLIETLTDSAEAALATGRTGHSGAFTRQSIASRRLARQAAGRDSMRRTAGIIENLSPSSRQASPQELLLSPQQNINLALTQAQLIQNSLQNKFNRDAQKPPFKMAALQLRLERIVNRLQFQASKANMTNTFVPNYAAILQPQIQALTSMVSDALPTPTVNQSVADSPSVGGNYLGLNGANPFTCYPDSGRDLIRTGPASKR
jgi:hypothetical protein